MPEMPAAQAWYIRIWSLNHCIVTVISTAEMPAAQVPILQRRIVQACRARGVPVVIATQMLESMVEQPVPR